MKKPKLPKYAVMKRYLTDPLGWYTFVEVDTLARAQAEVEGEVAHRCHANLSPIELRIVKLSPVGKVTSSATRST